jgi:hypothetical protein
MNYLLLTDYLSQNWRTGGIWTGLALLACLAIYFIRSRRMAKGWKKTALRATGVVLIVVVGLSSCALVLAILLGSTPREHMGFASRTGGRVALLSHSSFRDFTTTQVTVKARDCCGRYIAYDYQGDGDDYMGANSINWIDDRNLVIRYSVDASGVQVCRRQVGDVTVNCEARPAPTFENNKPKRPEYPIGYRKAAIHDRR